jgi:hypothetical protein
MAIEQVEARPDSDSLRVRLLGHAYEIRGTARHFQG